MAFPRGSTARATALMSQRSPGATSLESRRTSESTQSRCSAATRSGYWSGFIAGIDWIIANHIKPAVINASLGGLRVSAVDVAVTRAVAAGIVLVSSAGNHAADACSYSPMTAEPGGLVVGNVTRYDIPSSDSNFGPCVDIFAPGSAIFSASNLNDTGYTDEVGDVDVFAVGCRCGGPLSGESSRVVAGGSGQRNPQDGHSWRVAVVEAG